MTIREVGREFGTAPLNEDLDTLEEAQASSPPPHERVALGEAFSTTAPDLAQNPAVRLFAAGTQPSRPRTQETWVPFDYVTPEGELVQTMLPQDGLVEELAYEEFQRQDPITAGLVQELRRWELDPLNPSGSWLNRSRINAHLGRTNEAFDDLNQALQADPGNEEALLDRATLLAINGYVEEAVGDLNHLLELDPENREALLLEATTLFYSGQFVNAVAAADLLLLLNPSDQDALLIRANANLEGERFEEAVADYDRILEVIPREFAADIYIQRGFANALLGRTDDAIADFHVVSFDPENLPSLILLRGDLSQRAGDLEDALADFDRVLEIRPDNEAARQLRNETAARMSRVGTTQTFENEPPPDPGYIEAMNRAREALSQTIDDFFSQTINPEDPRFHRRPATENAAFDSEPSPSLFEEIPQIAYSLLLRGIAQFAVPDEEWNRYPFWYRGSY